jgi:acetylglutamate/LysW-gamma-L-alpha-aminoadipate kinase
VVLIHGGSHLTNQVATALGHPPQFVTSPSGYSSRVTDRQTLEIFEMVYCGKVNKDIVERLQRMGVNAVGLSGIDGRIWEGTRKKAIRALVEPEETDDSVGQTTQPRTIIIRNNFTGRVEKVNSEFLGNLVDGGIVPVLTPPAISFEGEAINVDGDRAAAATAVALKATDLVILSNIPGVLQDFPDELSLMPTIAKNEIDLIKMNYAEGRMRIKLLGAQEALDGGVTRVILGDARLNQPIQQALAGKGTVIQ